MAICCLKWNLKQAEKQREHRNWAKVGGPLIRRVARTTAVKVYFNVTIFGTPGIWNLESGPTPGTQSAAFYFPDSKKELLLLNRMGQLCKKIIIESLFLFRLPYHGDAYREQWFKSEVLQFTFLLPLKEKIKYPPFHQYREILQIDMIQKLIFF